MPVALQQIRQVVQRPERRDVLTQTGRVVLGDAADHDHSALRVPRGEPGDPVGHEARADEQNAVRGDRADAGRRRRGPTSQPTGMSTATASIWEKSTGQPAAAETMMATHDSETPTSTSRRAKTRRLAPAPAPMVVAARDRQADGRDGREEERQEVGECAGPAVDLPAERTAELRGEGQEGGRHERVPEDQADLEPAATQVTLRASERLQRRRAGPRCEPAPCVPSSRDSFVDGVFRRPAPPERRPRFRRQRLSYARPSGAPRPPFGQRLPARPDHMSGLRLKSPVRGMARA